MVDPTQILLIIVITTLTILLTIIGIQVFFILREVQRSVARMNKILDDAGKISESVAKPFSSLSETISGISGLGSLVGWLVGRKKKKKTKEEDE